SAGPKVNVPQRLWRNGLSVGDIGELHPTPGSQYAADLIEHLLLVGAEIDDAVGDHDIGPPRLDWHGFGQPLAKLDLAQPEHSRPRRALLHPLWGHAPAHHPPPHPDLARGDEAVEARPRADVNHQLPGLEVPQ